MIRFILIASTFGVLSLAWYQMSGGADFEPGTQTAGLPSLSFPESSDAPEVARAGIGAAELASGSLRLRRRVQRTRPPSPGLM